MSKIKIKKLEQSVFNLESRVLELELIIRNWNKPYGPMKTRANEFSDESLQDLQEDLNDFTVTIQESSGHSYSNLD